MVTILCDTILKYWELTGMPPRKIIDEHGERVYLQTWDWNKPEEFLRIGTLFVKT